MCSFSASSIHTQKGSALPWNLRGMHLQTAAANTHTDRSIWSLLAVSKMCSRERRKRERKKERKRKRKKKREREREEREREERERKRERKEGTRTHQFYLEHGSCDGLNLRFHFQVGNFLAVVQHIGPTTSFKLSFLSSTNPLGLCRTSKPISPTSWQNQRKKKKRHIPFLTASRWCRVPSQPPTWRWSQVWWWWTGAKGAGSPKYDDRSSCSSCSGCIKREERERVERTRKWEKGWRTSTACSRGRIVPYAAPFQRGRG